MLIAIENLAFLVITVGETEDPKPKDRYILAARILGAMEKARQTLDFAAGGDEKVRYEKSEPTIREVIGQDACDRAWTEGMEMSLDDAATLALDSV
ncbi:MAG: hypothetical protein ABJA67_11150 [Chthonomonadales bacterium]